MGACLLAWPLGLPLDTLLISLDVISAGDWPRGPGTRRGLVDSCGAAADHPPRRRRPDREGTVEEGDLERRHGQLPQPQAPSAVEARQERPGQSHGCLPYISVPVCGGEGYAG